MIFSIHISWVIYLKIENKETPPGYYSILVDDEYLDKYNNSKYCCLAPWTYNIIPMYAVSLEDESMFPSYNIMIETESTTAILYHSKNLEPALISLHQNHNYRWITPYIWLHMSLYLWY